MAYAALISLCTTIRDLAFSSHISLSPTSVPILKSGFHAAKSLIEPLKLLDESSKSYSRKNVNALDERIKEAIWKLEDLLDSHVYNQIFPQSQILDVVEVHLDEIIDDIESFTKMMEEFKVEYMYELDHLSPEEEVDVDVSSASADSGVKNCKMVGSFYFLWAAIRRQLEIESSLDVISFVGMAGIGKTTLAKKIFDDPLITEFEFESRAWVTIGRKWEPEKLIGDIITQLEYHSEEGERNEGYTLNGVSKAKRCLIVLDDVWDTEIWDHFKRFLPTHISGRILVFLTTRLFHVARSAEAWINTVELLKDEESWDLLRQRVFGEEESCPPELEKAGKKIAEECDGLPLMIITVADLLRQAEMTEEYWESIANKKNSSIFMTAYDRLYEVLFPSYEYLPQQLKPCFLYMGVFPQSCEIKTSKFLDMWIVEGFLLSCKNKTIEESSERYLRDLFDHNVVIMCERSSLNYFETKRCREIKGCRLQSSFWHLCKREATNTKFSHLLSTLVDVEQSMINTQRRLSVHNNILFGINNLSDFIGDVCASTAHSLLFYGPCHPYPVPICFNLRLVKVLDALPIRFYEFPILVFQQVYLRYLVLTYNGKLPSSISKFWNLQFLIINTHMRIKHSGVTSYMPIEIWDMKQLKHLQVEGSNLPNPSRGASLESLLKLKYVGIETCTKEVLERITNLKKLGILVDLHPGGDDMKALHCLNHVHVLRELTSLTCEVWNPILRPDIVAVPAPLPMLPSSLKKLHLSGMGYPWSYMSVIGSLPHLQVLKLGSYAFRGAEWVVKYSQFLTLKILIIKGTDLVKFKVEVGGLFGLGILYLSNCYKLRDLSWERDQCSPVTIQVYNSSTSTVAFANEFMSTRMSHIPDEHRPEYVVSSHMK